MAVAHGVGTFSIASGSTAAITPTITWSDAGTHTPQALLLWCRAGTGVSTTHNFFSYGMTDGTNHLTVAVASEDAVSASNTAVYRTNDAPLAECTTGGVVSGLANFTSFGSNQFTLTPSDAFQTSAEGFYIAFSGYDNVLVHVSQVAGSTGNFSKTGVGFQATCGVFLFPSGVTLDAGGSGGFFSYGWATGASNQACIAYRHQDAATTNYSWGQVNTTDVMMRIANSATTPASQTRFVSFDSDGYTLNQVVSDGGSQYFYGVLLLKGGVQTAVTTTAQTSTGNFTVTTTGVLPDCVLMGTNMTATASQTNAVEGVSIGIGAHTTAGQWAFQHLLYNNENLNGGNLSEEYSVSATNRCFVHYDRAAANSFTVTGDIAKSSFAANQITLNQNDADTANVFIPVLAFGTTTSASSIAAISTGYMVRGTNR